MFGTGCRIGEIIGLRWDDVDIVYDQYRVIFVFEEGGADNVKITDYH